MRHATSDPGRTRFAMSVPAATDHHPAAHPRARKAALAFAVLALLLLVAWIAIPWIARTQIESRLSEALGRRTTVESVGFDLARLQLTIHGLAIADHAAGPPLVAIDEAVANLSAASLWHRAPVLDALRIVRPQVFVSRDRDDRYNVQDLIDAAAGDSPGPPPRFSLNNIEVEDGTVVFDDGITGRRHTLESLDVAVPFVSSLPYDTQITVTPRVGGTFNGSRFALAGTTTPFADRREASLDVDVDALPLAEYVVYLPRKPAIDVAGGALTTRLQVVFVEGAPSERRLELRGDARIDGLDVRRNDGSALAGAERIALSVERLDVLGRDARVASLTVDAPRIDLERLPDGTMEIGRLVQQSSPPAGTPPAKPSPDDRAWKATLGTLTLARGEIALADEGSGFRSTLVDVALEATNVSTIPGEKAQAKLAFVTADRIASFSASAEVEPTAPAATGRFELAGFSLSLLSPYYRDALAVDVQKGSLDLASSFALDADGNLRLSDGNATIGELALALPGNRNPLWRASSLTVKGISADLDARKVTLDDVEGRGVRLRVVRERDGTLEMTRIVKPSKSNDAGERGWTVVTGRTHFARAAIDVEDRVPQPPVKVALRDVDATAKGLSSAPGARTQVDVRARVDRGRIAFTGPVVLQPFSLSGRLDAASLPLTAVKPYVEPEVNIVLTGGTLAAKGRIAVEVGTSSAARANWQGDVEILDFSALDKPTSSDLARWKTLRIAGLDVATGPFRAGAAAIALEDFYARAIVYPDATLNLARLVTPGESPEPAPDAKPATVEPGATRAALPLSIGRIDLARGNVNFSDLFVRPNYSANLTDVAGTVSALAAGQPGDVALTARVDAAAPVQVKGSIDPFGPQLALDIAGNARDVDLPPLTPYAVKYAGYGIEKGKLTFDVRYRVQDRKLTAENRLVLDQLTFGERVESPTATKLPVLLAVSLLKDAKGVIDIQLPISGSLDDPQFSVGGLIVRVIVNLLTKAVTAPFALLGAAFGGGEELSTIDFGPGSAALGSEAQKRVATLGKALADRPGLKLDIVGRADPEADRDALRRTVVDNALRREKMKALAADGKAPASLSAITIETAERNRWLAAAYREAPLADRPRNVFGMLKEVPAAEMEAMLLAAARVDDDALRQLANRRAQAVKDAIAADGVAGERLFVVAPRLGSEKAGTKDAAESAGDASRVDLSLR